MSKNNSPQLKDENTSQENTKNTTSVMRKLHSSEENHKFVALQNELHNAHSEIINLKIAQYKFTARYIDQLLCFYENLYKDISKFLELEHDQQKILHLVNALNEIDAIAIYSSKITDFAEAITGITPLQNKKIVSKKLLNKVIDKMRLEAEEKGIRFGSIFGKDIPYIMFGDYYRISKILEYLIANAIERRNSKGEITVTVNVFDKARQIIRYDKSKKLVLQFIVKSTAQLLYKGEQQLIYCPNKNSVSIFEDLNSSMELNIAIVKQLIHQIGGELDVRSNEEEGTVFVCFLPVTLPLVDNVINEIE